MSKFNHRTLPAKDRENIIKEVVAIVGGAKSSKALRQLLSNLLTASEIVMLGRRIIIAERIIQGKKDEEIRKELKVGFSTILTVHKWLEHSDNKLFKGRKKAKDNKKYRSQGYIIGSPEHGLSIIKARLGLLGLLLG